MDTRGAWPSRPPPTHQHSSLHVLQSPLWAWAQILPHPLQAVLIISGNLSFLNWLTMVPSVACFDDATLAFLFPSGPGGLKDRVLKLQEEAARGLRPPPRYGKWRAEPLARVPAWE